MSLAIGEVEHVFSFMQHHRWSEDIDSEFSAALLLGKYILQIGQADFNIVVRAIRQGAEVTITSHQQ
jgi:hypothetical protein